MLLNLVTTECRGHTGGLTETQSERRQEDKQPPDPSGGHPVLPIRQTTSCPLPGRPALSQQEGRWGGGPQPLTRRPSRRRTQGLLQELLERIHEVFTRHQCAEYVSPDVGVHSLLAGELQDL